MADDLPAPPSDGGSRRTDTELLRTIIGVISAGLDLDDTLRRLADLVTEVTMTDVCFVHLLDESGDELILAGATPPFDRLAGTVRLRVGEGVAGWVALHGRPAVVDDKWGDPRYKYIPSLRGEDFSSLVSVPMVDRGGRLVGVLNVHSRRRRTFAQEDVDLLSQVASLMAGAVENAQLHTRLAEREEALERFAQHTLKLQESERQRVAAEIHDGISQRIVSLYYHLSAAADASPPPAPSVLAQLRAARELASAALDEARSAIDGLRPPLLDDLGLGACLRELLNGLPPGIAADTDIDDIVLDAHVETAFYRIAQEAIQNIVKHARATRVQVVLRGDARQTRLVVRDDGIGFESGAGAAHGGYGLAGIRARSDLIGAGVDVSSAPGEGTAVTVTFGGRVDAVKPARHGLRDAQISEARRRPDS